MENIDEKICKIFAVVIAVIFALGIAAACSTTVVVESVSLDKTQLTLDVGASEKLTATVSSDDATDKAVTWSSSNTAVVTVDGSGNVTAAASGTATVTATADGKSATCSVTVNVPIDYTVTETEWDAAIAEMSEFDNYTYFLDSTYIKVTATQAICYEISSSNQSQNLIPIWYAERNDTDIEMYEYNPTTDK